MLSLIVRFINVKGAEGSLLKHVYPPHIDDNTTHIYIGFIASFGGDYNSSEDVTGVRAAIDRINSDTDILKNYTLHYVLSDSQVSLMQVQRYVEILFGIIIFDFISFTTIRHAYVLAQALTK